MKRIVKYILPAILVAGVFISAAFNNKPEEVRFVQPEGWPEPVYQFAGNKPTAAGFQLGRKLFFEKALSRDGSVSCASCHAQQNGYAQADALSIGAGGVKGKRNALPLFNLAWNKSFMWDGGINHLEVQPLGPITNGAEMNNTLAQVVKMLSVSTDYKVHFYNIFGDSAITGQRILKTLAQYLVVFESFNSKYDKYVRNEQGGIMSAQELRGLQLFRRQCASCHTEPLFSNYSFQNTGLAADLILQDKGRMNITQNPRDSLKFKVPSLRNIARTAPYMHDGRFGTLQQVLDHYTNGIAQSPTLAEELRKPMLLSAQDKRDIIAFLQTLTDEEFLRDQRYGELSP